MNTTIRSYSNTAIRKGPLIKGSFFHQSFTKTGLDELDPIFIPTNK